MQFKQEHVTVISPGMAEAFNGPFKFAFDVGAFDLDQLNLPGYGNGGREHCEVRCKPQIVKTQGDALKFPAQYITGPFLRFQDEGKLALGLVHDAASGLRGRG